LKTPNETRQKYSKGANMGRHKTLSVCDVRHLKRSITKLRSLNPNFILKELIRFSGLQSSGASYSTFYREINSAGFKYLNARKKLKGYLIIAIVGDGINLGKNVEKF
jgi:hypothetical protein